MSYRDKNEQHTHLWELLFQDVYFVTALFQLSQENSNYFFLNYEW